MKYFDIFYEKFIHIHSLENKLPQKITTENYHRK